jgi:uncharacterized RDD family membrane protein YckC
MKRIRAVMVSLVAAVSLNAGAAAQPVPQPPEDPAVPQPERPFDVEAEPERRGRETFRFGMDYTLAAGQAAREVVVVFGDATIEGRVDRSVVVVFGNAKLSNTATIDEALIVVGGNAAASAGARIGRDLVVVGGAFDGPPGFMPGGEYIVVGPGALGGRFGSVIAWVTRGLLWGRPIVPDLPWVWIVVVVFFLVYLGLSLVFEQPVRACASTLATKPLTAFAVGLLVLLLLGPICLLLAVSVVGVAVVPLVICAVFAAGLIGKAGVAQWIGTSLVGQRVPENRLESLRALVIGFGLIVLAYMVPILGLSAWTLLGVLGLGAATLAFITAYRTENPPPVPRVASSVEPVRAAQESAAALPGPEAAAVPVSPPPLSPAMASPSDLASFPRASFRDRLAAFVLDIILVMITVEIFDLTRREGARLLFILAYHIGFWTWKATTVGGIICQLRIVRVNGEPLRFSDALVRGLSSIFSLAVVGLGFLWILKDPEKQAWHDKIAGTYVVKVPRNWPL